VADLTDFVGTKWRVLQSLIARHRAARRSNGYGASRKGNTLSSFCGTRADLAQYWVDRNPFEQGVGRPGARIPINYPEALEQDKPDCVLGPLWGRRDVTIGQLTNACGWGAQVIIPMPQVQVL
jgi:hypothetical protein